MEWTFIRNQSKAERLEYAIRVLKANNLILHTANNWIHTQIYHNKNVIDFWPTTGRWRVRGRTMRSCKAQGFGIDNLCAWLRIRNNPMAGLSFLDEIETPIYTQRKKWINQEYRKGAYHPFIVNAIEILIRYGTIFGVTKSFRFSSDIPNRSNIPKGENHEGIVLRTNHSYGYHKSDYCNESGEYRIVKYKTGGIVGKERQVQHRNVREWITYWIQNQKEFWKRIFSR